MVAINAIVAIIGVMLLAGWALYLGFDGILYLTAIGVISGLGGYTVMQEVIEMYGNVGEALADFKRKKAGGHP